MRLSSNPERGHEGRSPYEESDVVIGRVISVNVPRRELRIAPDTSHPERFHSLRQLRLQTADKKILILPIVSIRLTEKAAIAKVECTDADEIAGTRGALVMVRLSERFPLPEHEYYIDDLIGLRVKDPSGRVLGFLKEVWQTSANDIYQVVDDRGGEILLPAIEDVIIRVDLESGELIADISTLE